MSMSTVPSFHPYFSMCLRELFQDLFNFQISSCGVFMALCVKQHLSVSIGIFPSVAGDNRLNVYSTVAIFLGHVSKSLESVCPFLCWYVYIDFIGVISCEYWLILLGLGVVIDFVKSDYISRFSYQSGLARRRRISTGGWFPSQHPS